MNIVVLAGGLSTERDVSFKTGDMVTKALRKNGHQVILLDVFMGYGEEEQDITGIFEHSEEASVKVADIPETAPDLDKVRKSRKDQSACFFGPNVIAMCRRADIVFMALHGENGENGKIQAAFDLFGIRYTGSGYLSSAIAMNKNMAKQFFEANGIPCPKGIYMKKKDRKDSLAEIGITLPCVVKPCCGGSSIGVSIVKEESNFTKALEDAFFWEDEILIEEYVEGREFSVGVIKGRALPVIEIAPKEGFYDYKNKYKAGSTVETCPADIKDSEMQKHAVKVAEALGLDTYSRIDFLVNAKDEVYCLEANTLPGMTATSLLPQEAKVEGVNFEELCQQLVDISMEKYGA